PESTRLVHGLVFVTAHHLALFLVPFFLGHQDRQRDMVRVLLDHGLDLPSVEQFVLTFAQMQRDGRAALGALDRIDIEFAVARAAPAHAFGRRQAGPARFDRDAVGHDKARIETDPELADQLRILLLVARQLREEIARTRLRDRAEVGDRLFTAHADTVVVDGDRPRGLVEADTDPQ